MFFIKNHINKSGYLCLIVLFLWGCNQQPEWPEVHKEHKPWTRWWWMGSAVNQDELTRQMELYEEANLGGVEITPIYGAAGYEDQYIEYLTDEWLTLLDHVLAEGERLNLGIDLATGTGWPFGGPWVSENEASKRLYFKTFEVVGGQHVNEQISNVQEPFLRSVKNTVYELHGLLKADDEEPQGTADQPLQISEDPSLTVNDIEDPLSDNKNLQEMAIEQVRFERPLPLITLMGYSNNGNVIDLTDRVDDDGILNWEVPAGEWTLYALFEGWHGKTVERAAPGGEGYVIDHFSSSSLDHYLAEFDSAFKEKDISYIRSFFNDSYEVDDGEGEANWTPDFLMEFEKRRGYDLREHLPFLFQENNTVKRSRVLTDYRETISDLMLEEFTNVWKDWAQNNETAIRNQAHGSPANILDLYAASNIPETEGTDIIRAKMASSAANVTGKKLISSESATWLNEHFVSTLSDIKEAVDRYFISGVNHIFYHGTSYSPHDEDWPGWLFYASVHLNERNPNWEQFSDFNRYVTHVQSFLQSGKPDNDILLYYPIYDQWAESDDGLLRHFDGGLGQEFQGTALKEGAEFLVEKGYAFDFISDSQLKQLTQNDNWLVTGGINYQTIVVPKSQYIPLQTFKKLVDLASQGATVIAYDGLPGDVPGFHDLENRQDHFKEMKSVLSFNETENRNVKEAVIGNGRFIQGESLEHLLEYAEVQREPMVDYGLQTIRRKYDSGYIYFIANWSNENVDGWVPLSRNAASAAIYDPIHYKTGYANIRNASDTSSEIYLQLGLDESVIIKTDNSQSREPSYPYLLELDNKMAIEGTWNIEFTNGGPEIPNGVEVDSLISWTEFNDNTYKYFSGVGVYNINFGKPEGNPFGWKLNLGEVHEHATIVLNGEKLSTQFGPEYEAFIPNEMMEENNQLKIKISNLMTNRIIWMENESINWKKFYNVNFPARLGVNRNDLGLFDASGRPPVPSGLIGPVTLTPVELIE